MKKKEIARIHTALNTALRIVINAPVTTRLEVLWGETNMSP